MKSLNFVIDIIIILNFSFQNKKISYKMTKLLLYLFYLLRILIIDWFSIHIETWLIETKRKLN